MSVAGCMAGRRKTLPILDNVRITFGINKMTVASYDGEALISKRMTGVYVEDAEDFCIDPKDVLGFIGSIPDEELGIEVNNGIATIVHSNGQLSIPVVGVSDFPEPVRSDEKNIAVWESGVLADMLIQAKGFIKEDPLRPVMSCANLYCINGMCGVVGSDGASMFVREWNERKDASDFSILISNKFIKDIVAMISRSVICTIYEGSSYIRIVTDDSEFVAIKIDGRYPNFKAVIPNSWNIKVTVDKKTLVSAVRRVVMASEKTRPLIKIHIVPNKMTIEAQDIDFNKSAKETIPCDSEDVMPIGLNGTAVLNVLDALSSPKAVLKLVCYDMASVWENDAAEGGSTTTRILLMPMILNN